MSKTGSDATAAKTQKTTGAAEDDLSAVLRELRSDLGSLRQDIDALKSGGVSLGRASVRTAQQTAQEALEDVRERAERTVRTVEDDVLAVGADLKEQVQRNPYMSVGLAVLGGMLLGRIFKSD
ncbi:DUF883 family protein [Parvularcula oceani]|uniref:DUF883 family protein n=1 Tax=Parvularcula oceani TaxID=1247963 RepID=UPI0004E0E9A3|nr:DUF883 family protein [Parvularcula oceani]